MNKIKQTYLFLSAQQYRIVDENTGIVNEGISLWYLPDEALEPEQDELAAQRGEIVRGKKVGKVALQMNLAPKLKDFPALYEVTLDMVMVAQRQQVRVRDIDFIGVVDVVPRKDKGQVKQAAS